MAAAGVKEVPEDVVERSVRAVGRVGAEDAGEALVVTVGAAEALAEMAAAVPARREAQRVRAMPSLQQLRRKSR